MFPLGFILTMVTINNSELFKELKDGSKLQQLTDIVPSQLQNIVVPVMEVNPKLLRRCNIVRSLDLTNSSNATIYTVPADRDFFLCGATLSVIKDVTATSVKSRIEIFASGIVTNILTIVGLSLTVQSETISSFLPFPVRIDKGSIIKLSNSTNVANVTSSACICGYYEDSPNA